MVAEGCNYGRDSIADHVGCVALKISFKENEATSYQMATPSYTVFEGQLQKEHDD